MASFQPDVEILEPRSSSGEEHLGTVRIDVGERRVHVLFYGDGHVRFRVNHTPMVINESYLRGGQNDFTIIGLKPGD